MSSVTDKYDAAAVPLLLGVDSFVVVQGGEHLLNRLGKPIKATRKRESRPGTSS